MLDLPPEPEHRERMVLAAPESFIPTRAAIPLYDNIYVLAYIPPGEERDDLIVAAQRLENADQDQRDQRDVTERDRMYALAIQFISEHVRMIKSGSTIRARDRLFGDGTVVVSEKPIPRFPIRLVKLNWAIDRHMVVDVHDHRVLRARLTKVTNPARRCIWTVGKGDEHDVAYLLGNLCALLDIHVPESVAATGVVAPHSKEVLGGSLMEDKRQAAILDHMAHFVVPYDTHLMPGDHEGVRYWPVRDAYEANYSLLSVACSDLAFPDLRHRWRMRMVYSWASLLTILGACGAYQFAVAGNGFVGNRALLGWTVGVWVALSAFSSFCTHKYRNIDR
jgi:hypothetical protein